MKYINLPLLFFIAACGAESTSDFTDTSSNVPLDNGVDYHIKSVFKNADVRVYELIGANTCRSGLLLNAGKTDNLGNATIKINPVLEPTFLITEISGGQFFDAGEKTLVNVPISVFFNDLKYYSKLGGNKTSVVTGLTDMLFHYQCFHIEKYNNLLSGYLRTPSTYIFGVDLYGFEYSEILAVTTSNLNLYQSNKNQNAYAHSLHHHAVSLMVAKESQEQNQTITTIEFWEKLSDDVRHDGVINGIGANDKEIMLGSKLMNPDFIRTKVVDRGWEMLNQEKTIKNITNHDKQRLSISLMRSYLDVSDITKREPAKPPQHIDAIGQLLNLYIPPNTEINN